MPRRNNLIYWAELFILIVIFDVWGALYFLARYVRDIPNRRMPFAEFFTGNVPRFYEWFSDVLFTALQRGLEVFLLVKFILAFASIVPRGFGGLEVSRLLQNGQVDVIIARFIQLVPNLFGEALLGANWLESILTRGLATFALSVGIWSAWQMHWIWLRWRVLPAARNLAQQAGGPDAEPDEELIRFLMDAEAGLSKAHWIVEAGELRQVSRASGPAARFGGPGILITQEGHAVVLEKSGGVSRVVGRGITYLAPFERPTMVVKLHSQSVRVDVENVFTKDGGIIKKIQAVVFCRLNQGRRNKDRGTRFEFDDALIIDRVWSPSRSDPRDTIQIVGRTILIQVVARHTLHEFFDDVEQARSAIQGELLQETQRRMIAITGYDVIAAVVNNIEVPPETEQKLWQRWEVVQDSTIGLMAAKGAWEKAHIDLERQWIEKQAEGTIRWFEENLAQEIRMLSAGTEQEIAQQKAAFERRIMLAQKMMELGIRQLTAQQEREIKRQDTNQDIELDRQRIEMLSNIEQGLESRGGNIRVEVFTRFVRMIQLTGHEPSEDTLRELARVLLTSRSPRSAGLALQRLITRAMSEGKPVRDRRKTIEGSSGENP